MDLAELRTEFRAVRIMAYGKTADRIGAGQRMVFWVAGDGRRTAVFNTLGEYFVIPNDAFDIDRVHGADETKIVDGRIQYLQGGEWQDLGAYTVEGVRDGDLPISDAYKLYVTNELDEVAKTPLDTFWLEGGSL